MAGGLYEQAQTHWRMPCYQVCCTEGLKVSGSWGVGCAWSPVLQLHTQYEQVFWSQVLWGTLREGRCIYVYSSSVKP